MAEEVLHAYIAAIRVEHRELNELMRAVRHAASEGARSNWSTDSGQRFVAAATELQRHLLDHLRQEEDQGALDEALSFAPRFHAEVRRLAGEHPGLAGDLREILVTARAALRNPADWGVIAVETESFLQRLSAHETAENRVLQEAFDTDLELGG